MVHDLRSVLCGEEDQHFNNGFGEFYPLRNDAVAAPGSRVGSFPAPSTGLKRSKPVPESQQPQPRGAGRRSGTPFLSLRKYA